MNLARRQTSAALVGLATLIVLAAWLGRVSGTLDAVSSFAPFSIVLALLGAVIVPAPRLKVVVWACMVIATVAPLVAPDVQKRLASSPAPAGRHISIVTHNVAVRNRDPAGTAAILLASDADILLLQETDGTFAPFIAQLKSAYPYSSACKAGCSLAILSKFPIDRVRYRFRQGKVIAGPSSLVTTVHLPTGESFQIATLHLPWPLPAPPQAAAREALVSAVGGAYSDDLIVAGDFNLTPWSAAMASLDKDLKPLRRVTLALPSFPARLFEGAVPTLPVLPIDHVFAGPRWTVQSTTRLPRTGSDHFGVKIKLVYHQ